MYRGGPETRSTTTAQTADVVERFSEVSVDQEGLKIREVARAQHSLGKIQPEG